MRGLIYIITTRSRHRCITIEGRGSKDGEESAARLIHVGRLDRGRLYVATSSNASKYPSTGDRDEEAEGAGVTMVKAAEEDGVGRDGRTGRERGEK